jgi:hypothetical protein
VHRPRIARKEQVTDTDQGDGLLYSQLASSIDSTVAHPVKDLLIETYLLGTARKHDCCVAIRDHSIGKGREPVQIPDTLREIGGVAAGLNADNGTSGSYKFPQKEIGPAPRFPTDRQRDQGIKRTYRGQDLHNIREGMHHVLVRVVKHRMTVS